MKVKRIALNDGNFIPIVGFGTYLCTPEEAYESTKFALSIGYEHVDSAEAYKTEAEVGKACSESLMCYQRPFVTTKLLPKAADEHIKSYDEVIESFNTSLAKLDLPYVDLYLIHAPFGSKESRVEQWRALVELKASGKCKSIGVSNYSIRHLEEIVEANLPLPSVNQIEIHPLCQRKEIVQYCKEKGIVMVAYSSLAPLSSWRVGQRSAKSDEDTENSIFEQLAVKYNCTPAQFLLKWALQQDYVILPKSVHPDKIRSNFEVAGFSWEISREDMENLSKMDENHQFAWKSGDPTLHP